MSPKFGQHVCLRIALTTWNLLIVFLVIWLAHFIVVVCLLVGSGFLVANQSIFVIDGHLVVWFLLSRKTKGAFTGPHQGDVAWKWCICDIWASARF